MERNVQRLSDNVQRRDSTGRGASDDSHRSPISALDFRRSLVAWQRKNGRSYLPWRRTRDPYAILVSEFMLQQTQVTAVIPYYERWMGRFPDFATLAKASETEVLHAWQGLGYYARARNLHATARLIVEKYAGHFPKDPRTIRELPGVGRYTANAIASFAFNESQPIIEANTARLLARLFDLRTPIDSTPGREKLWHYASTLLPKQDAGFHNSALMDLGALVCRLRPQCDVCPVRTFCRAKVPGRLPVKKARPVRRFRTEHHGFSLRNGRILLERSQDRWRGMWILPRLTGIPKRTTPLHTSEFQFTNHRVTLIIFPRRVNRHSRNPLQRWFPIDGLPSLPLPSPHRRALEVLIGRGNNFLETLHKPSFIRKT